MDEKPDQIIGHIEAQRHQLGRNLNELESRVRATTNWRTYFDKSPVMALGVALGGGILLGSMVGSRTSRSASYSSSTHYSPSPSPRYSSSSVSSAESSASAGSASSSLASVIPSEHRRKITDTLEQVKGAVIAFGIAKAKEFLNDAIPGFGHHLSEAEQRHHASGPSPYGQTSHTGSQDFRTHTSHESYQPVGS